MQVYEEYVSNPDSQPCGYSRVVRIWVAMYLSISSSN